MFESFNIYYIQLKIFNILNKKSIHKFEMTTENLKDEFIS